MSKINVIQSKGKIVIEIPIEYLKQSQEEERFDPYKIVDEEGMIDWIENNIVTWGRSNSEDSAFQLFLEATFDEAYDQDEDWIEDTCY